MTVRKLVRQLKRLTSDFPTEYDALKRRAFWRLAARFTPMLAVDREDGRFLVSTDDLHIGRRLFVYHTVAERDIKEAFAALHGAARMAALDGRTVVELGANIGSHTVAMLEDYGAGSVVAVEPDPSNCQLLRQNLVANGLADRAAVLPVAVSDREGVVELELSAVNSGDHRVRLSGGGDSPGTRPTIEVRATTFDALVESGEVDLDAVGLVWVDTQGHEGHVLSGAGRLLASDIPVLMEYWPNGLRRAGGLDTLHELVAEHYEYVIDVSPAGDAPPRTLPAAELRSLEADYGWASNGDQEIGTDLILAKGIPGPAS